MAAVANTDAVYVDENTINITALILKRAKPCKEGIINSKRPIVTVEDVLENTDARVLLRRLYFVNMARCSYVSVGFYPSGKHQVLFELGGPWIEQITLTEHHFGTLVEAMPALCEAMQRGGKYPRKSAFRLRSSKIHSSAKLYRDKKCVSFTLTDLCCMMTMLHVVEAQLRHYVLAKTDVISYAYGVLGSIIFAQPTRSAAGQNSHDLLLMELQLRLI